MTREEGAAVLRRLADVVESGSVELGDDEGSVDVPEQIEVELVREYDAVFVEDLDVKDMLEQSQNARNKQDAAWRQFITLLEYKADLYGCHVVQVEARGTTKECASCGVETAKPI